MSFEIRRATIHDVSALFAIRTSVRENHMTMDELAKAGVTPSSVADLIDSQEAGTWLGMWQGQPAGFAMARANMGDLFALFVLPEMEGRGLGRHLLVTAEKWSASRGVGTAWLLTGGDPRLRAAGFYAAHGWRVERVEADGQVRFTKLLPRISQPDRAPPSPGRPSP